jgi:hypothetical protein
MNDISFFNRDPIEFVDIKNEKQCQEKLALVSIEKKHHGLFKLILTKFDVRQSILDITKQYREDVAEYNRQLRKYLIRRDIFINDMVEEFRDYEKYKNIF